MERGGNKIKEARRGEGQQETEKLREGKKEFVEEEWKGAGTGLKRHEEGRGGRNSCVKV